MEEVNAHNQLGDMLIQPDARDNIEVQISQSIDVQTSRWSVVHYLHVPRGSVLTRLASDPLSIALKRAIEKTASEKKVYITFLKADWLGSRTFPEDLFGNIDDASQIYVAEKDFRKVLSHPPMLQ